jgi:voltage-gated potassium channel
MSNASTDPQTDETSQQPEPVPFDHFVTILGWDTFSESITGQLLASSNRVVIITDEEGDRVDIEETFSSDAVHVAVMHFSNFDRMKAIGIGASRSVFLNLESDEEDLIAILRMKGHFSGLDYMVALTDEKLEQTFRSAGVTYAVSRYNISSKVLASYLYEPDVAEYTEDLLTATEEENDHDIQQYRVTGSSPAAGDTFLGVMKILRSNHGCVPIGLKKEDGPLLKVPAPDVVVGENDYVLLITDKTSEAGIEEFFGSREGILNGRDDLDA